MSDVNILDALVQGTVPFLKFLLGALMVILTVNALFLVLNKKKSRIINEARKNKKENSLAKQLIEKGGAYVSKDFLMTPTEQKVYKVLEREYSEQYYIFAQVRVVDVLQPNVKKYSKWTKECQALFWQVSQWHFDYVMCHKDDFRIFCVLELDDPSHDRPDRQRRDRILNSACKDGGVTLKRMSLNHENKKIEVANGY